MKRRMVRVLPLLILIMGGFLLYPGHLQLRQFRERRRELDGGNERLKESIENLKKEAYRLKTDPIEIERLAREMGLARPGEIIYRVKEDGGH